MKIVILDGRTVVGDDLTWDKFNNLGDITVYDRTSAEDTVARIGDAEAIFLNKVVIDRAVMEACPNLKYIGIFATGYNVVDIVCAKEKGIVVANVPAYSTDSVAQMVFAYILDYASSVAIHNDSVHNGEWNYSPDFCFWKRPLVELVGKTLGIIGYGAIGKRVAELAKAFKMNVLYTAKTPKEGSVDIKTLLEQSDYISLHCPLTADNAGLICKKTISYMKPSAVFINTARGGLVAEQDLADALNQNVIAKAYLDVVSKEPIYVQNPLLKAKNCVLTPHIAWAPYETRERLIEKVVENFIKWREGNPQNNVAR